MRRLITLILLSTAFLFAAHVCAEEVTPKDAIAAEKSGDHQKAIKLFSALADAGDSKAMIHIGNKFYNGDGVAIDYEKAMDWWLRALFANNGDAPGNIGVLYRDGKGVKQNRKIAYDLFLLTHMEGLGTDSTQMRVNNHLRREQKELPSEDVKEALCYTMEYVLAYVDAKGSLTSIPQDVLPSSGKIRIKDNGWWLESERKEMIFTCKSPWN